MAASHAGNQQGKRRAAPLARAELVLAALLLAGNMAGLPSSSQDRFQALPASKGGLHALPEDAFTLVKSVGGIPQSVKKAFGETKQGRFDMAEPQEQFQSGCIVVEGRPNKRLRLAGLSDRHCFLVYESGGVAHSFNLALFQITGDQAQFLWRQSLNPKQALKMSTVQDVRDALASPGH